MTNKTFNLEDRDGVSIPVRYVDNGDGTFSPDVSGGGGGAGSGLGIANSAWVDPNGGTPRYYVRREVDDGGTFTVTWENLDGTTATPTVDNLVLVSGLAQAVASVDLGVKADTSASSDTGTFSLIALFKRLLSKTTSGIAITASTLPLPTGAATATNQDTINTNLGAVADSAYAGSGSSSVIAALKGIYAKLAGSLAVTGTFWQATQPVSAASLPLPTGAATAANQATANASLASTVTALTGGQKGQATSVSVIQASDPDVRPGSQTLSVVDSASTTTAGNNSVNYMTGTPTAGSAFVQAVNGVASATVSISAITGTLNFEVSGDGSLWVAATARQRGASYTVSSTTGKGVFEIDLAGKQQFRCRLTAGTSATFTPSFTTNGSGVQVMNPIKLYDNTSNAQATIKPASTASVATDTAMVVTPRPGDLHTVVSYQGSITATVVTLSAASSGQLIASNTSRKGLRWQNIGSNPMTVAPGASAAVVGQGFQYGPSAATGYPGDGESFEGNAVPTNAFQAISTLGTTVVIWEQT